ncbi:MAG: hypothetical protein P8L18_16930 [Verrucomicrobiota bacterium]|nr:hypothetical protein [Verrucomicrobiota bacterium]
MSVELDQVMSTLKDSLANHPCQTACIADYIERVKARGCIGRKLKW